MSINGIYKVTLVLPKRTVTELLKLEDAGDNVKGYLEVGGKDKVAFTGTLKSNNFVFRIQVGPGTVDFKGFADGKKVSGEVTVDNITSHFEGNNVAKLS